MANWRTKNQKRQTWSVNSDRIAFFAGPVEVSLAMHRQQIQILVPILSLTLIESLSVDDYH
jgi:hypothetical protein